MSGFNNNPIIKITNDNSSVFSGWNAIIDELKIKITNSQKKKNIILIETYQGVFEQEVVDKLASLKPDITIFSSEAMKSESEILEMTYLDVTDDRIFGYMSRLNVIDFFNNEAIIELRKKIESAQAGTILLIGAGVSLICEDWDLLIYADMARWEIQQRMKSKEVNNLGISNSNEGFEAQYKRGFFVDWRALDRLKKKLFDKMDYVLDTNRRDDPTMITGQLFNRSMDELIKRPFSVVPYFDPGPWGGQWMKEVCNLDPARENYAWCFNCVPEENSMLLGFGDSIFESPSINLVFRKPLELLGDAVYGRFGDEFPIRFDLLDTIEGGNLSLQVHPLTEYVQEKFGMHYTQDESYYMLDAKKDAKVYLGFKKNVDQGKFTRELRESEKSGVKFDADAYVETWPAKKHDHFLIPAGTIHCSGANGVVLEISSTPYIFTFKLYDWNRLGIDGKPRPINVEHGLNVLQWNRDKDWVKKNLIDKIETVAEGDGWKEEKTGLHEKEFIETRRHWFTKKSPHNTNNGVNVLTLVEGDEVVVESPDNKFDPFIVRYPETFIVPAAIGKYTISPYGKSEGKKCGTIKAFVRTNA